MTPYEITAILHIFSSPRPLKGAPLVQYTLKRFYEMGLIEQSSIKDNLPSGRLYGLTKHGLNYVRKLEAVKP
jgi:hypothetical protein